MAEGGLRPEKGLKVKLQERARWCLICDRELVTCKSYLGGITKRERVQNEWPYMYAMSVYNYLLSPDYFVTCGALKMQTPVLK